METKVISYTAGVVDQVTNGDRLTQIGKLGDVLANVIFQVELPSKFQQGDGSGCELFGGGGDIDDRIGSERSMGLKICHPIPTCKGDPTSFDHSTDTTRRFGSGVIGKDLVDSVVDWMLRWGAGSQNEENKDRQGCGSRGWILQDESRGRQGDCKCRERAVSLYLRLSITARLSVQRPSARPILSPLSSFDCLSKPSQLRL